MLTLLLKETKKGRDVELTVSESGLNVKRISDEVEFQSSIHPIDFASYLFACLADRTQERLLDRNAKYIYNGKEMPALFLVRPTSKGRGIEGDFGFRAVPAIITVQNYDHINPIAFDAVLTALDVMHVVSALPDALPQPQNGWNLIAGTVFVSQENGKLLIRCGGSEPAELTEDLRRLLVHRLARYLSGQYIDEEQSYSPSFFNRNGVLFNGRKNPRLRVHGITAPLNYQDVAALYLILRSMKGREVEETVENTLQGGEANANAD